MKGREGFSIVEGLLITAVLVVVGAVGYLAYSNLLAPKTTNDTTNAAAAAKPVTVASSKDLDTVNNDLNQLTVDDSELTQLDSAINSF